MGRIAERVKSRILGATLAEGKKGSRTHLLVRADGATTKIHVTPVLRGCIRNPETQRRPGPGRATKCAAPVNAAVSAADFPIC
jgi:hypothetical protein